MSGLEKSLGYFVENVTSIIQIVILIISFLFLVLLGMYIRKKEDGADEGTSGKQFADIEAALKKVLEQTQHTIQHVESSPALNPEEPKEGEAPEPVDAQEILQLQTLLKEREEEIKKLKEQPNVDAESDEKIKEYLAKINDLEGRLLEYEIIEDDIADLSKYKEENAQLKTELENLKSSGAQAEPDSEEAPKEEPAVEEAPTVEEPEIETEEPTEPEASEDAPEEPAVEEEAAEESASEELAEQPAAEAELDEPEPQQAEAPAPESEVAPAEVPVEEVEVAPEEVPAKKAEEKPAEELEVAASSIKEDQEEESIISDDILAEFSAAIDEEYEAEKAKAPDADEAIEAAAVEDAEAPAPEETASEEDSVSNEINDELMAAIDTDKMVAEMAGLDEIADATEVLEEESDIDKMVEEAAKLEKD